MRLWYKKNFIGKSCLMSTENISCKKYKKEIY